MGRHVRGRQAGPATRAGAGIIPPPLLGFATGPDADRPATSRAVPRRRVNPAPSESGPSAASPGSATVTLPDGTWFRTQPGRQYTVPVGSRMTLPSRITRQLDRPGPTLNIEDRSRIHVAPPEDLPAA